MTKHIFAYGATEPEAGSDLGALTTTATRIVNDDDELVGYRINGNRDLYPEKSWGANVDLTVTPVKSVFVRGSAFIADLSAAP